MDEWTDGQTTTGQVFSLDPNSVGTSSSFMMEN